MTRSIAVLAHRPTAARSVSARGLVWALAAVCAQPFAASHAAADGGDTRAASHEGAAHASSFGSVQQAGSLAPIQWESAADVELTSAALRLAHPDLTIRSAPLPLTPLQHYRIRTTMGRGPGGTPRFAISYRDARGNAIEWLPSWQHKHATHANWLPLSPHPQRYVQGFVLPEGASQARVVLRLDAGDKAMARYADWTLTELQLEAIGKVVCCEHVGANGLLNGDFEAAAGEDGLPKWWTQWGVSPGNRVELVELAGEPARKHVVRVRAGTSAQLSARFFVPVEPGSAFRLSLWVRGQGRIELDVHSLSGDRPMPLRVGNSTRGSGSFEVQTSTWQQYSITWFAEAPNVALANVVVAATAQSGLELDTIELRPFE